MIKWTVLTLVTGALLGSSLASADDPKTASANLFAPSPKTDDVQCTMIAVVRPVLPASQSLITKENINKFLPTNMTPGTNAALFSAQFQSGVEQKMATSVLEGDLFRSSPIGKAATKVEGFSKASLPTGTSSNGQKSSLEFQVKVAERQAVITYKGTINSEVIYMVDQGSFKWTLSHIINKSTTLAWTNISSPSANTASSILSLTHSF